MFDLSQRGRTFLRTSEESTETLLPQQRQLEANETCTTCKECGRSTLMESPPSLGKTLQSWMLFMCLLCTTINLLLSFDHPSCDNVRPLDQLLKFERKNYNSLTRPSPFINLENVIRPQNVTPRTILNYPQAIIQVDAANPNMVFDDDPKRYMSKTGFVSPEDRRVKISKSISTVVEFRAIDFGMELCELKVRFPPNATASEGGSPMQAFFIGIHRLDTDQSLNTKTLSYRTLPPRLTNVANIEVLPGKAVDYSHKFQCPWDTSMSFELSCFGDDRSGFNEEVRCSLEWWQNKDSDNPEMAVFMKQHSTV